MKEESKKAKHLRWVLIALNTMLVFCLSMPFGANVIKDSEHTLNFTQTGLDLVFSVRLTGTLGAKVLLFSLFFIIPTAGFFTACFDTKRNIKSVVAVIGAFIGVTAITFLLGSRIQIGALLSLLLYLCTAVVGVMSLLVSYSEGREAMNALTKK